MNVDDTTHPVRARSPFRIRGPAAFGLAYLARACAQVPAGTHKWAGGTLGPDGRIYCVPLSAPYVLIIDPASGTVDTSIRVRATIACCR